jgi:hypothetical protein
MLQGRRPGITSDRRTQIDEEWEFSLPWRCCSRPSACIAYWRTRSRRARARSGSAARWVRRSATVVGLVLRQTLCIAGIGVLIGLAGALALSGYLRDMLFDLTPLDSGDVRSRGRRVAARRRPRRQRAGMPRRPRRSAGGDSLRNSGLKLTASSGRTVAPSARTSPFRPAGIRSTASTARSRCCARWSRRRLNPPFAI